MAQNVEITLDAKEAGAVRAWLAVQRAVDSYSTSLGQVDQAQQKNAKAAAEFDRANAQAMANAKRVIESLLSPQQRYHESLESLASLHSRGLLSTDQYLEAMKREKAALDANDASIQKDIQRKKQLEAAGKALTASTQTATERYQAEIARLNELKSSGAISEETYARAVRKSREELLSASGHVSKREKAEGELGAELKRNADLDAQRGAIAQRVLQSIQTPQQRYNTQLRELTSLRKENRITEEQYAAAVRKSKADLDASKDSNRSWLEGIGPKLGVAAAGYVSVSAAVGGIKTALNAVMESNKKFIEDAEKAGALYDKIFRQFRIQAGLDKIGGEKAKKAILQNAEIAGFTEDRAGSAATALVSAGVSSEQASGGALSGFLATLNAQGLRDVDPSQYADAMTAVLQSNQMEVNQENMTRLGVQLQSPSIKDTKLKLTDLPQLAGISSGLSGALTQQEQLATYAVGGSVKGSFDKFATSMADIIKNLQISGSKKDATEYLGKVGLKPTDVDFVDEDFKTVMTRLKTALDKAPEEKRKEVLAKVIEGGNIDAFQIMQNNLGKILDTAAAMDGADAQATYQNDVAVGSSGIDAATTRQDLRRRRVLEEQNTNGNLLEKELEQASLERGDAPVIQDATKAAYNKARYLGLGDEYSAQVGSAAVNSRTYTGILPGLVGAGLSLANRDFFGAASNLYSGGRAAVAVSESAAGETAAAREAASLRMASSLDQQVAMQRRQLEIEEERLRLERNGGNKPNTTPARPVRSASNDDRPGVQP